MADGGIVALDVLHTIFRNWQADEMNLRNSLAIFLKAEVGSGVSHINCPHSFARYIQGYV